jgi:predicted DNA-binding transcriptional regulator AlpA
MKASSRVATKAAVLRAELGYIDEAEFAALLEISLSTLRNRASQGALPTRYKIGRRNLYRMSEVQTWIARRAVAK